MKKIWILLPVVLMVFAAGFAFSKGDAPKAPAPPAPQSAERDPGYGQHRFWESFPRNSLRLGIVLSDEEPGAGKGGVRVEKVIPDSPAEKAGLQRGDVIMTMDSKKVTNPSEVRAFLKQMDDAREIQLGIERDGSPVSVKITPEKRDMMAMGSRPYLGVDLQELNPDLASYFQVAPNAGVLIARVEPGSPAEKADLRSGDVITAVNGRKVQSPEDVVGAMHDLNEGDSLELSVVRHGAQKTVSAKPEQREMFHGMMPEIPDVPAIREMIRDNPQFHEDMENLHRQMDQLREEMQMRKEDLQKMKEQIHEDVQKQMEDLRKQLKDLKNES